MPAPNAPPPPPLALAHLVDPAAARAFRVLVRRPPRMPRLLPGARGKLRRYAVRVEVGS